MDENEFVEKVERFEGRDGQHYFRLRAANGEIVAQSEAYTTRQARDESARKLAVQLNVPLVG